MNSTEQEILNSRKKEYAGCILELSDKIISK